MRRALPADLREALDSGKARPAEPDLVVCAEVAGPENPYQEVGPGGTGSVQQALGAAFLEGLETALRRYREEGRVFHPFRCRFRERANARDMMRMLERVAGASHIQITQRDLHREGGHWILEFDRIYPSLNGILGNLAAGGLTFD